ncbi:MAG: hypothetical protein AABN95_01230 [Acidobacteriota bacterium]
MTTVRHLLSTDVGPENLCRLVDLSCAMAANQLTELPLKGKVVGVYFQRASTRTRRSFMVAAIKLGAVPVAYGPNDLQISTGETIQILLACYRGISTRSSFAPMNQSRKCA